MPNDPPSVFNAVTAMEYTPLVVGVPDRTPVLLLMVMPGGSADAVKLLALTTVVGDTRRNTLRATTLYAGYVTAGHPEPVHCVCSSRDDSSGTRVC